MFLPRVLQLRLATPAVAAGATMAPANVAPLVVAYLRKHGLTKTLRAYLAETSIKDAGQPPQEELETIYGFFLSTKAGSKKRKTENGASKPLEKKTKVTGLDIKPTEPSLSEDSDSSSKRVKTVVEPKEPSSPSSSVAPSTSTEDSEESDEETGMNEMGAAVATQKVYALPSPGTSLREDKKSKVAVNTTTKQFSSHSSTSDEEQSVKQMGAVIAAQEVSGPPSPRSSLRKDKKSKVAVNTAKKQSSSDSYSSDEDYSEDDKTVVEPKGPSSPTSYVAPSTSSEDSEESDEAGVKRMGAAVATQKVSAPPSPATSLRKDRKTKVSATMTQSSSGSYASDKDSSKDEEFTLTKTADVVDVLAVPRKSVTSSAKSLPPKEPSLPLSSVAPSKSKQKTLTAAAVQKVVAPISSDTSLSTDKSKDECGKSNDINSIAKGVVNATSVAKVAVPSKKVALSSFDTSSTDKESDRVTKGKSVNVMTALTRSDVPVVTPKLLISAVKESDDESSEDSEDEAKMFKISKAKSSKDATKVATTSAPVIEQAGKSEVKFKKGTTKSTHKLVDAVDFAVVLVKEALKKQKIKTDGKDGKTSGKEIALDSKTIATDAIKNSTQVEVSEKKIKISGKEGRNSGKRTGTDSKMFATDGSKKSTQEEASEKNKMNRNGKDGKISENGGAIDSKAVDGNKKNTQEEISGKKKSKTNSRDGRTLGKPSATDPQMFATDGNKKAAEEEASEKKMETDGKDGMTSGKGSARDAKIVATDGSKKTTQHVGPVDPKLVPGKEILEKKKNSCEDEGGKTSGRESVPGIAIGHTGKSKNNPQKEIAIVDSTVVPVKETSEKKRKRKSSKDEEHGKTSGLGSVPDSKIGASGKNLYSAQETPIVNISVVPVEETSRKKKKRKTTENEEDGKALGWGSVNDSKVGATVQNINTTQKEIAIVDPAVAQAKGKDGKVLGQRIAKFTVGAVDGSIFVLEKTDINGVDAKKRNMYESGKEGGPKFFQKINVNEVKYADPRLQDNSYWAKDGADEGWGAKAQEILGQVKGKGFRHEKTKKKRGSYKGGTIDFSSHSIKFQNSDEE